MRRLPWMAVSVAVLTLGCADTSNLISPLELVPYFDLVEVPCPNSTILGESTTQVTCYSFGEAVWDILAEVQDRLDADGPSECGEALASLVDNAANLFLFDGHSNPNYQGVSPLGGSWAGFRLSEYLFEEGLPTSAGVHTIFHEGLHLADYDHPDFGGESEFDAFAATCLTDYEFEGPGPGHPDPV